MLSMAHDTSLLVKNTPASTLAHPVPASIGLLIWIWIAAPSDDGIIRTFSRLHMFTRSEFSLGASFFATLSHKQGLVAQVERRGTITFYCCMAIVFHSPRLHKHLKHESIKKDLD